MDWLIIGKDSAFAKQFKLLLFHERKNHEGKIYESTRREKPHDDNMFYIDLSKDLSLKNINISTTNGVAMLFAAQSTFAECEKEPQSTYQVNVVNMFKLAQRLSDLGWRIVYPSSSAVFDAKIMYPKVTEITNPKTEYGKQKVEIEHKLLSLKNSLIVRFSKIIFSDNLLFKTWFKKIKEEKNIEALSDYYFSPLSAQRACHVLLDLVQSKIDGIWHVGACDNISYAQAANIFLEELNKNSNKFSMKVLEQSIQHNNSFFYSYATSLNCTKTEQFLNIQFPSSKKTIVEWIEHHIE